MRIMPSLLEQNAAGLFHQIKRMRAYYSFFQIDIADGDLVPNKTLQPEDISSYLHNYITAASGLGCDIHLMVRDYKKYVQKLTPLISLLSIRCALVHFGAQPLELDLKNSPIPIGLVLNPEDNVEDVVKNYSSLNIFPEIQLMTVHPGFQGGSFIGQSLNKIEQLRNNNYRNEILIDGAVNLETADVMRKLPYPPDTICPGSYLTRAPDLEHAVAALSHFTE